MYALDDLDRQPSDEALRAQLVAVAGPLPPPKPWQPSRPAEPVLDVKALIEVVEATKRERDDARAERDAERERMKALSDELDRLRVRAGRAETDLANAAMQVKIFRGLVKFVRDLAPPGPIRKEVDAIARQGGLLTDP